MVVATVVSLAVGVAVGFLAFLVVCIAAILLAAALVLAVVFVLALLVAVLVVAAVVVAGPIVLFVLAAVYLTSSMLARALRAPSPASQGVAPEASVALAPIEVERHDEPVLARAVAGPAAPIDVVELDDTSEVELQRA